MALAQLFDPEPPEITPQPYNPSVTPEARAKSHATNRAIRETLNEALDLKRLAYEVAMDLKERSSPEVEDMRRARAQAVASAIKAWELAADRVRIVRGKGLPKSVDTAPPKRKQQPSMFTETKPE